MKRLATGLLLLVLRRQGWRADAFISSSKTSLRRPADRPYRRSVRSLKKYYVVTFGIVQDSPCTFGLNHAILPDGRYR
jgi:hypothetical protein